MRFVDRETKDQARKLRANPTPGERLFWTRVRGRRFEGLKFRRQHPSHGFIFDFFCHQLALAVEIDGVSHNNDDQRERDRLRDTRLARRGIAVVRFQERDVLRSIDEVLEELRKRVVARSAQRRPRGA